MNTEDLFKYGVTPKEGMFAGKRFIVDGINKAVVFCHNADDETHKEEFTHGSYDIWHEPKTLFEDDSVPATWGNLKKAIEQAGISDDTEFVIQEDSIWASRGLFRSATFAIETLREIYGKPKKYIVIK